jgi:hypothetical protein
MNKEARSSSPLKAITQATQPEKRFMQVIVFGICFFIAIVYFFKIKNKRETDKSVPPAYNN